jgi:hypothetical protein
VSRCRRQLSGVTVLVILSPLYFINYCCFIRSCFVRGSFVVVRVRRIFLDGPLYGKEMLSCSPYSGTPTTGRGGPRARAQTAGTTIKDAKINLLFAAKSFRPGIAHRAGICTCKCLIFDIRSKSQVEIIFPGLKHTGLTYLISDITPEISA